MYKCIKLTILLSLFCFVCCKLNSQSINYYLQHYQLGLNQMKEIRQTIIYNFPLSKKISIEGQLFVGRGHGKDISNNFEKDYILLSKGNSGNVPSFLNFSVDYYDGIYSYKRISSGLRQDFGWGLSINYLLLDKESWTFDISVGYLVYKTKAIIRDTNIDLKISLANTPSIVDYAITYPAAIHMSYNDGAAFSKMNLAYKINNRLDLGLLLNFNYSLWNTGIDIGTGLGIVYHINIHDND